MTFAIISLWIAVQTITIHVLTLFYYSLTIPPHYQTAHFTSRTSSITRTWLSTLKLFSTKLPLRLNHRWILIGPHPRITTFHMVSRPIFIFIWPNLFRFPFTSRLYLLYDIFLFRYSNVPHDFVTYIPHSRVYWYSLVWYTSCRHVSRISISLHLRLYRTFFIFLATTISSSDILFRSTLVYKLIENTQ